MNRRDALDNLASARALVTCALACALALAGLAAPASAFAEVRKADVIYGQTVDSRGLSVAQCPSIDAEYACVMGKDGTVYFERNAASPTQIASITKVMTAVVALDAASLDTIITVTADAAAVGESSAGLQEGDSMSLEVALKALLVPSGNDAAVAIAQTLGKSMEGGSGSDKAALEAFVNAMNAKAAELGCADTVYRNPHGLDADEYEGDQHSTAADVAKVAQCAMQSDTIRQIVSGGDTGIVVTRDGAKASIDLETTDELLDIYTYAIGIKTGFTQLAGPSFAGAASKEGEELYAIVINSSSEGQRFSDAQTLFEWVYGNQVTYTLANSPQTAAMTLNGKATQVPVVAEVAHGDWVDKTIKATFSDPTATIQTFALNGNISQSFEFLEVTGDVKAGQKLGTATFKQRNQVVATADIIACEDVAAPTFFEGVGIWWDRLFRGFSNAQQVAASTVVNQVTLIDDKTTSQ